MKIWQCKVGESVSIPKGADGPMRDAVARAYKELTGEEAKFIFSGWGAELTEPERAVVEDRLPAPQPAEPPLHLLGARLAYGYLFHIVSNDPRIRHAFDALAGALSRDEKAAGIQEAKDRGARTSESEIAAIDEPKIYRSNPHPAEPVVNQSLTSAGPCALQPETDYNLGWSAGWDAHKRSIPESTVKESLTVDEPVKGESSEAWALIEKYADAVSLYNEAVRIDVGIDKAGADCLSIEKQLRDHLDSYGAQPAASVEPICWWVTWDADNAGVAPLRSGLYMFESRDAAEQYVSKVMALARLDAKRPEIVPLYAAAPVAAQPSVPESVIHVLNKLWEAIQGVELMPLWQEVNQARRDLGIVPTPPADGQS